MNRVGSLSNDGNASYDARNFILLRYALLGVAFWMERMKHRPRFKTHNERFDDCVRFLKSSAIASIATTGQLKRAFKLNDAEVEQSRETAKRK